MAGAFSKNLEHKNFQKENIANRDFAFESFSRENPLVAISEGSENTKIQNQNFPIKSKPLFVLGKYFLVDRQELILVDLEAARYRVFYDSLKSNLIETQKLMFPIEIIDDEENTVELLQKMGFDCHRVGMKKIVIEAIPSFLDSFEVKPFFEAFKEGRNFDIAIQKFTKSQNRNYNLEQAQHLFSLCLKCSDCMYDPSGKKIQMPVGVKQLQSILSGKCNF